MICLNVSALTTLTDNKLLAELLLRKMKPSEINKLNDLSQSCLHEAAARNRLGLIQLLIAAGALTGKAEICFTKVHELC
jgi:ankyrin repeat protein